MICVVGSGLSGATAAHFMWRAGFDVVLLDAGLALEPRLAQNVEDYLADPDSDRFVAALERHRVASATDEWPISADQLAPYYRALDEIVEVVGERDGLDICFGEVADTSPHFPLGRQGAALLADLAPHRGRLADHGIHFGRARLAVGPMYSSSDTGCVSCGLCIHGCPYGAIFNAAHVVDRLRRQERFDYRGNLIVERVVEHDDTVTVYARDLRDGARYTRDFERVFVAAGAVSSTAIVARSLASGDSHYRLRDSQLFIFPIFRPARAAGAMDDPNARRGYFGRSRPARIDRPDTMPSALDGPSIAGGAWFPWRVSKR